MDCDTLLAMVDFVRGRLVGSLDGVEKSGMEVAHVLGWRPGPGRAHMAWQAMHCAATHDKYVNAYLRGGAILDEELVRRFGGGSVPSDEDVPDLKTIREKLEVHFLGFKEHLSSLTAADLGRRILAGGRERTVAESVMLLAWHEAHHQGQIHLTWNLYRQRIEGDRGAR